MTPRRRRGAPASVADVEEACLPTATPLPPEPRLGTQSVRHLCNVRTSRSTRSHPPPLASAAAVPGHAGGSLRSRSSRPTALHHGPFFCGSFRRTACPAVFYRYLPLIMPSDLLMMAAARAAVPRPAHIRGGARVRCCCSKALGGRGALGQGPCARPARKAFAVGDGHSPRARRWDSAAGRIRARE